MEVEGVVWKGAAGVALVRLVGNLLGPPTRELGELLADRIGEYRAMRAIEVAQRWEEKCRAAGIEGLPPPRFIRDLLQDGTWDTDPGIQELWASLLANASAPDGEDLVSISFTGVLKRLGPKDAAFLKRHFTRWGLPRPSSHPVRASDFQGLPEGEHVTAQPELSNLEAVGLVRWEDPQPSALDEIRRAAPPVYRSSRRPAPRQGGGGSEIRALLNQPRPPTEPPGARLTRYGVRFLFACLDPLPEPLPPPAKQGPERTEWFRTLNALLLDFPQGSKVWRMLKEPAGE